MALCDPLLVCIAVLGVVGCYKAIILARTVHDLVELVSIALLLLAASAFLSVGNKVPFAFAVRLGRRRIDIVIDTGLVLAVANVDGVFSIGVLISEVKHLSDSDVLLPAYVAVERVAIHYWKPHYLCVLKNRQGS